MRENPSPLGVRFAFINDRRLQATLFCGGLDGRMSSGRANLAAEATAFRRLKIHLGLSGSQPESATMRNVNYKPSGSST